MKSRRRHSALTSGLCAFALALAAGTASGGWALPADGSTSAGLPWLAPGLTTSQRVNLLLETMTLDQKIAELHADDCQPYEACIPAVPALGLPELVLEDDSTGVGGGMSGVTALPATIAASASFDPSVINAYGQV